MGVEKAEFISCTIFPILPTLISLDSSAAISRQIAGIALPTNPLKEQRLVCSFRVASVYDTLRERREDFSPKKAINR